MEARVSLSAFISHSHTLKAHFANVICTKWQSSSLKSREKHKKSNLKKQIKDEERKNELKERE